jgi:hypothetical protein
VNSFVASAENWQSSEKAVNKIQEQAEKQKSQDEGQAIDVNEPGKLPDSNEVLQD